MLAFEWNLLTREMANTTLSKVGIGDITDISFAQILHKLHMESSVTFQEMFPILAVDEHRKINISHCVEKLTRAGIVNDIIGPRKLYYGDKIYFLTLVNPTIKGYLTRYIQIAKQFREDCPELEFAVWLDDRLSVIKTAWDTESIKKSVEIFRDYSLREAPWCKLMISAEISPGIPIKFANEHLTEVTGRDLLSILPHYQRHPDTLTVLNVIHFAWMHYLLHKFPGIHLAGENTNRQYEIFRKAGEKRITAVLIKRNP